MRPSEPVFVDTGAWVALALAHDPYHRRAREAWDRLRAGGGRPHTSAPVVVETFTFLDRNAHRDVALKWKDALYQPGVATILACELVDLSEAWAYFRRTDMHKLSAVDATSFVIMKRAKIRAAFAFDHHFAVAGFEQLG
jgi:predicted nucleic acid-binding protein